MNSLLATRAESALADILEELSKTAEAARALASERLDDVDTEAIARRTARAAEGLRAALQRRLRPAGRAIQAPAAIVRRRRTLHWGWLVGAGVLVGAVGVGVLLSSRERRAALAGLPARALDRYAELRPRVGASEAALRSAVERAVANGGSAPEGLTVAVEGRTVYLRGEVADPSAADAAAERAHGVPGVAAVVNLTTGRVASPTSGNASGRAPA